MSASIGYLKSRNLRPLAITTKARSELFPETPALADSLPGYEITSWSGIAAPARTPREIIDRINAMINAVLADPAIKKRLTDLGTGVFTTSPMEFSTFIRDETERLGKVIRLARIKPD